LDLATRDKKKLPKSKSIFFQRRQVVKCTKRGLAKRKKIPF
jgi:hypothetical protein